MRFARLLMTFASAVGIAASAAADQPNTALLWREDLQVIGREMPRMHPDLFYRMRRAVWDSAVTALERRLPTMSRNQAMVGMMELVALANDGHTTINPLFDPAMQLRYYPLDLRVFEDGVFITAADSAHASWVGSRVLGIGKVGIDQAMAAAARTIPSENEWWTRSWIPQRLMIPEVLDGLGLVDDMEKLPLQLERQGRRDAVVVRPGGRIEARPGHAGGPPAIDRSGWIDMRSGLAPMWQRNPGVPYWVEYLEAEKTLYVCYRAVMSMDQGESSTAFWRRVFALADSLPLERFVLDVRENTGGNHFFNRQVVRGLIRRPAIDRPDRLFVIVGGRTFSAAMNLVLDLEHWTGATFVGEPTGNATYFFGDHRNLALPQSRITVNVSSLTWRPYDPRDRRDFVAPSIYTPMTSGQYKNGHDPALQAVLGFRSSPDVPAVMEAAVLRGDTAAAQIAFDDARRSTVNRFRPFEADVNRLGYSLLNARHEAAALTIFRMNARAYPKSANAWDSLGEALAISGRKRDAIVAYRQALVVDPEYRSSREALERLGDSR